MTRKVTLIIICMILLSVETVCYVRNLLYHIYCKKCPACGHKMYRSEDEDGNIVYICSECKCELVDSLPLSASMELLKA